MIFKKFNTLQQYFLSWFYKNIRDTSPSIIINQSTNNNDGTFTLDLVFVLAQEVLKMDLIFTLKMK